MIGPTVEDAGLAGAAGALGAGGQHAHPGILHDSRIDRSGGTVRVSPLRTSSTSNASVRTGAVIGRAANRSTCNAAGRPGGAALLDRGEQRLGAAAVDEGFRLRGAQQRVEVEQAGLVLRADRNPLAVGGQLVQEGHRGPLPPAVDELPLGTGRGSPPRSSAGSA